MRPIQLAARAVVVAALAGALAPALHPLRAQAASPCAVTGPGAIPAQVVPGLGAGPHTLIVGGVRLWYCVAGHGSAGAAPVVFLHGGPGQGSQHFAALVGPLLEPALRMVYLDQRGSGRSERPWTHDYTLDRLVEDVEALRVALGVPRVSLIGHSFGVALALEYAAKYPAHVARMVLASGLSDAPALGRGMCARLRQWDPTAYARAIAPDSGAEKADPQSCNLFRALGPRAQTFFNANMFPDSTVRLRLDSVTAASGLRNTGEIGAALFEHGLGSWRFTGQAKLTMPVLAIAGGQDYQVETGVQRQLAASLPNARFLLYERAGHFVYLDEPARFARDVTAFLNGTR